MKWGYLDDFVALSDDIRAVSASQIRGVRVTLTMIGGNAVFQA